MTKRFTPKASTYTDALFTTQQEIRKLRNKLVALEATERALTTWLLPFYEEGKTEVDTGSKSLLVKFTTSERTYLDQTKAQAIIVRAGKKVPTFTSTITSFKVSPNN
jgi:hypothetical protein